jgi:hypothetical protein
MFTDGEEISQSSDLNLRQEPGAHAIILSVKGSYVQCGKCWIINLTSAASHVGLTLRRENNFESYPFSLYIARRHMLNYTC